MNAFTSNASLVLHASDQNWMPDDLETLINFLQKLELIGQAINKNENSFLIGEKFLNHISFMGCSPHIKFDNEDNDGKFTFIRLHLTETITTLTSQHSFAPHCPQCKKPEKTWRDLLKNNQIECSHCQTTSEAWHYNWRKSAGFSRCYIEITDIFPKETIPQPAFLKSLENKFLTSWTYFYYRA